MLSGAWSTFKGHWMTFVNPLMEAFEEDPPVQMELVPAHQFDNIIGQMPMDDRPMLYDPDYVAEPSQYTDVRYVETPVQQSGLGYVPESITENIDPSEARQIHPFEIEEPPAPEPPAVPEPVVDIPVVEVPVDIPVVTPGQGFMGIGSRWTADYTVNADGYDPLAHPNYMDLTEDGFRNGPATELQQFKVKQDMYSSSGPDLGTKVTPGDLELQPMGGTPEIPELGDLPPPAMPADPDVVDEPEVFGEEPELVRTEVKLGEEGAVAGFTPFEIIEPVADAKSGAGMMTFFKRWFHGNKVVSDAEQPLLGDQLKPWPEDIGPGPRMTTAEDLGKAAAGDEDIAGESIWDWRDEPAGGIKPYEPPSVPILPLHQL